MTDLSFPTPTEEIIKTLTQSPSLPLIVQHFERLLEAEQEKRQQFYETLREDQKAEFINGEIIVQSPVKMRHNVASRRLLALFHTYVEKHNLGFVGYEKILVTLSRNDYEPDICYFNPEKSEKLTPTQMKFPAPDLVVEVLSDSTEAIDRGTKFEDYALHGVREYWIVDAEHEFVEQYLLRDDKYQLSVKAKTGIIDSEVIAGLQIPVRAIFDAAEQLAALQAILS